MTLFRKIYKLIMMNNFFWALTFLTVIPIGNKNNQELHRTGSVACWFPIVGLCIGIIISLFSVLFSTFFPPFIADALVLVVSIAITGALHLDGLPTPVTASQGGRDKGNRLSIMKDSRIKLWGNRADCLLGLKYACLVSIGDITQRTFLYVAIAERPFVPTTTLANLFPSCY